MKWEVEVTVSSTGSLIMEADTEVHARKIVNEIIPDFDITDDGNRVDDSGFAVPDLAVIVINRVHEFDDEAGS